MSLTKTSVCGSFPVHRPRQNQTSPMSPIAPTIHLERILVALFIGIGVPCNDRLTPNLRPFGARRLDSSLFGRHDDCKSRYITRGTIVLVRSNPLISRVQLVISYSCSEKH